MSIFSNFTGGKSKKRIAEAGRAYRGEINQGFEAADQLYTQGLDQSLGYVQPYVDQGQNANQLYSNALGVNGQDAQQGFYDNYQADAGFQDSLNFSLQAADRQANAGGRRYSGAAIDAAAGIGQRTRYRAVQNRLNRLASLGQQGYGAASSASGLTSQNYNDRAGLKFGTSQLLGNQYVNQGNALAANASTGINNLFKVGSLAVEAFNGGGGGGGGGQQKAATAAKLFFGG